MEKKFIRVDEVAKELEISESHAYKIMRKPTESWRRKAISPLQEESTDSISMKDFMEQKGVKKMPAYRDFTEITQTMLNEFIDKIVIFEATGGRTVNRSQRIDIYFNFIGQFVVEDTEEEILSQQEEEKRLAELKEQERKGRRNETVRRYRQRKKEKQAAEAEAEKSRCA